MTWIQRQWRRPILIRLLHWEYWPFHFVYGPIYIVWVFLCLRARSFFFFNAANPTIQNGGFLAESKRDICDIIPQRLQPKSVFFEQGVSLEQARYELIGAGLSFPLIGKPNTGARGRGVRIIEHERDLDFYIANNLVDFHIQEYIGYPLEVGIFYYRYPGQPAGRISGIVKKELLRVKGDGSSTIKDLLLQDSRGILQLSLLEKEYGLLLNEVLERNKDKLLVPYGNHARGAKFLDCSDLIDPEITSRIDEICQQIPQFYFGRLDVRFSDFEKFKKGVDFCIIEVNGAGSEPTHIYDPRHSIFFAWKEIVRHWIILWRISRMNHREGIPYLSVKGGLEMFRQDRQNSKKLAKMRV